MKRKMSLNGIFVTSLVIALGMAASGPAHGKAAKPKSAAPPESEVLAWVGNRAITRKDLESRVEELAPQFRQQFGTAEGRKQLLDRMVEEQVWLQAAEKAKVDQRPEMVRQIEQQRRALILRTYVGEVMQGVPAPTDSAVTAFFEAHKTDPQYRMAEAVKLRHIQVASEAEAKAVLAKLKKGADFATLAKETSTDAGTKSEGGLVGRLERNGGFSGLGPQPALTDTAFKVPLNVPIGPLRSTVGWHVIEVEEKIPAQSYPIENMRPRIMQMLGRQTQEEYYKKQLEKAKEAAGFRLNQVVVDSFLVGKRSAPDLFREAQDAANADDRIAGYERVVHDFPKSDQAPQAEFMIGFVYSEEKKDYDKAEAAFKKLLADYPKSELRHSAEWMLANMRSDAVPDFDLPGGVKRAAVDTTAKAPGTTPQMIGDKGRASNGNKK